MTRQGRRGLLAVLLGLTALGAAAQQRMTNVAVVDITKIQTTYYSQSARFKEFNAFKDDFQKAMDQRNAEIGDLQVRRAEANRAANQAEVNRLDGRIAELVAERDTFRQLKEQQRIRLVNELLSTDKFFRDVRAAVQYVCNQEGYALALTLDATTLLWWDPEVDITQKVIARMAAQ